VKTVSGFIRSYLEETKGGVDIRDEWKYIAAAFVITVLMTSILVLMLPETPFEFW
jgi:hypothetical protein